ncbi:hypothetical protein AB834_05020 [PVC group bacterium (ex Bugula neritina AB1)]|nr:hypothetical protein AB834_05020 [PVC group bacterium (ex Bugula neritina AB1)]
MDLKNLILNELAKIVDPDLKKDIVSLGFVKDMLIDGRSVSFILELTTKNCPIKDKFKKDAEDLLLAIDGIDEVHVSLSAGSSHQVSSKYGGIRGLSGVKKIIAVSSCKGGVGKSTVAALLAKEISSRGFKVGIVDLDIFGPSLPTLFRKHERVSLSENREFIPHDVDGIKLMSFGFLVGDAPAVVRGPIATNYTKQLLTQTFWGELDYLIIDAPPGTGDIQLTMTQTVPLDGALVVTTSQILSLNDVIRGIKMFEKVNVPILGIIENMAYQLCCSCSAKNETFGQSNIEKIEDLCGVNVLAQWPLEKEWTKSLDLAIHKGLISSSVDSLMISLEKYKKRDSLIPRVSIENNAVILKWEGGEKDWKVTHRDLRFSCKCAHCVDELTGQNKIVLSDISEDIFPKKIDILGNYALAIQWNDGHSSGIYPYKRIQEIL